MSIFGRSSKPAIAAGPAFSEQPVVPIGDLTPVDSLVLQTACEACLSDGYSLSVLELDLFERTRKVDLSDEAVRESVLVLRSRGYLVMEFPASLRITFAGFEIFLKSHRPDYEKLLKQFASLVINDGLSDGDAIGKSMQLPRVLLDQIVDVFTERKWLVVARYGGGGWEIADGGTSPELKRWLTA